MVAEFRILQELNLTTLDLVNFNKFFISLHDFKCNNVFIYTIVGGKKLMITTILK